MQNEIATPLFAKTKSQRRCSRNEIAMPLFAKTKSTPLFAKTKPQRRFAITKQQRRCSRKQIATPVRKTEISTPQTKPRLIPFLPVLGTPSQKRPLYGVVPCDGGTSGMGSSRYGVVPLGAGFWDGVVPVRGSYQPGSGIVRIPDVTVLGGVVTLWGVVPGLRWPVDWGVVPGRPPNPGGNPDFPQGISCWKRT